MQNNLKPDITSMSQELKTAVQAAKAAAEIIRLYSKKDNFEISLKGKNDLVTDADVASEKEILKIISAQFLDDVILAEESAADGDSLTDARTWIIDPIDGTTNFAPGLLYDEAARGYIPSGKAILIKSLASAGSDTA